MKWKSLILAIFAPFFLPASALAGVTLLSVSKPLVTNGLTGAAGNSLAVGLNYFGAGGFGYSLATHVLFSSVTIRRDDAGVAFMANSTTDAEFDRFVMQLTNGTSEVIAGDVNFGGSYLRPTSGGMPEANFFALPADNNGIDFEGFSIDHIDFVVTAVHVVTEPSVDSQSGFFTDYFLAGVFKVYGENLQAVPEPTAVGMAMVGIVGLMLRRKR